MCPVQTSPAFHWQMRRPKTFCNAMKMFYQGIKCLWRMEAYKCITVSRDDPYCSVIFSKPVSQVQFAFAKKVLFTPWTRFGQKKAAKSLKESPLKQFLLATNLSNGCKKKITQYCHLLHMKCWCLSQFFIPAHKISHSRLQGAMNTTDTILFYVFKIFCTFY